MPLVFLYDRLPQELYGTVGPCDIMFPARLKGFKLSFHDGLTLVATQGAEVLGFVFDLKRQQVELLDFVERSKRLRTRVQVEDPCTCLYSCHTYTNKMALDTVPLSAEQFQSVNAIERLVRFYWVRLQNPKKIRQLR